MARSQIQDYVDAAHSRERIKLITANNAPSISDEQLFELGISRQWIDANPSIIQQTVKRNVELNRNYQPTLEDLHINDLNYIDLKRYAEIKTNYLLSLQKKVNNYYKRLKNLKKALRRYRMYRRRVKKAALQDLIEQEVIRQMQEQEKKLIKEINEAREEALKRLQELMVHYKELQETLAGLRQLKAETRQLYIMEIANDLMKYKDENGDPLFTKEEAAEAATVVYDDKDITALEEMMDLDVEKRAVLQGELDFQKMREQVALQNIGKEQSLEASNGSVKKEDEATPTPLITLHRVKARALTNTEVKEIQKQIKAYEEQLNPFLNNETELKQKRRELYIQKIPKLAKMTLEDLDKFIAEAGEKRKKGHKKENEIEVQARAVVSQLSDIRDEAQEIKGDYKVTKDEIASEIEEVTTNKEDVEIEDNEAFSFLLDENEVIIQNEVDKDQQSKSEMSPKISLNR